MATVVQKNGMKPLTNGTALVHELQTLSGPLGDSGECVDHIKAVEETATQCIETVEQENEPEIDIVINNVVCSFSVRCHLNLRQIALNGVNVEYRRENGMITMKLRRPYTTASIWSSGKVTCTGATSEDQAKIAARRFARSLQKLGFKVRFNNFRVVNVLGTCSMPFAIRINSFSAKHKEADYEPELHPGVTYKLKIPKATLKIFSTGSITVTASNVADVQTAIEYIYPLVHEFSKERTAEDEEMYRKSKRRKLEAQFAAQAPQQQPCESEGSEGDLSDRSWD